MQALHFLLIRIIKSWTGTPGALYTVWWVIFVGWFHCWLAWQSTNFPYGDMASPRWWVWPQTSWQRGQQAIVATVIQLIASSTLIFFYLMLFVQVSVAMAYIRRLRARSSVCIDYIIACADRLLSQNLKSRKLILRTFSDYPQKLPAIQKNTTKQHFYSVFFPIHTKVDL